ncbi:MAG: hypothetical protein AB1700_12180, partial [Bacillota bacterium]
MILQASWALVIIASIALVILGLGAAMSRRRCRRAAASCVGAGVPVEREPGVPCKHGRTDPPDNPPDTGVHREALPDRASGTGPGMPILAAGHRGPTVHRNPAIYPPQRRERSLLLPASLSWESDRSALTRDTSSVTQLQADPCDSPEAASHEIAQATQSRHRGEPRERSNEQAETKAPLSERLPANSVAGEVEHRCPSDTTAREGSSLLASGVVEDVPLPVPSAARDNRGNQQAQERFRLYQEHQKRGDGSKARLAFLNQLAEVPEKGRKGG